MKTCSRCKTTKPKSEFSKDSRMKDGLRSNCRSCDNVYQKSRSEQNKMYSKEYQRRNREKIKERDRIYYANNRDHIIERVHLYRKNNPEKVKAQDKAKRQRHLEQYRERDKRYRQTHKEKTRANQKLWLARNHQRHNEWCKKWRQINSEQARFNGRVQAQRRRARQLGIGGNYTRDDVLAQYKAQRGRCYWCDKPLGRSYETDHVIPLAHGGSNGKDNIVVAHMSCNRSKSDKLPHEWDGNGGKMF